MTERLELIHGLNSLNKAHVHIKSPARIVCEVILSDHGSQRKRWKDRRNDEFASKVQDLTL